jgi:hypothetical protein
VGAQWGAGAIPESWLTLLEGAAVVDAVARDLQRECTDPPDEDDVEWAVRYPPW